MSESTPAAVPSLTAARRVSPLIIVAAVVALAFIGIAALVASEFAPPGHDTSVVTAFVLSTIAPTTVGLLALIRGDHAVQVGEANADRLVATAKQVSAVAQDVNGHLHRHDALAAAVTTVAETVAAAAGVQVAMPRDPETRTRADDEHPDTPVTTQPPAADTPPLSDQS